MATKKTTKAEPEVVEEVVEEQAEPEVKEQPKVDPMEEYVEIELFRDDGNYSGDVLVSINDDNCLIRRGERVRIKRKFAIVLEQSMNQERKTAKAIAELTRGQ